MPTFDIVKTSEPTKSFRVASVMGKFDLQSNAIQERFTGSINLSDTWQIGLIVGKSGTGKTTIAKQLFPDCYITNFEYNHDNILDDMPENKSVQDIVTTFNCVGFSSPPSWLKPYHVLSNGEKMRVDLARAILSDSDMFVFDEFTSVVDRQVAQIGSFAMQKAIRKTKKKFIAVTCHFDVEDWLLPDWIFNTDTMTFQNLEGQKKNRPEIKFEIFKTADKSIWKMFAKYHYLNHSHNDASSVYVGIIDDNIAGFISVIHFPHPKVKNMKRVHRLVVLPDYQGIGIGVKMLNSVGDIYRKNKDRFTISTSSSSLIQYLKKEKKWSCNRFGRTSESKGVLKNSTSKNRVTASFELS
jgi:GNAT superfamily N-acetyltransferase